MTDTTGEIHPAAPSIGSWLFHNRRWVHPVCLGAALLVGGATPAGRVAGAAMLPAMLAVRMWAARSMRGAAHVGARKAQQKRVLLTVGPFALVRNPIYLANTLGLAGACLLFGPAWLAALAAAVCLLWYRPIIAWEEALLARLYGDEYRTYVARVPRLLPRVPPAPRGDEARLAGPRPELYPWPKVFRRERGAIATVLVLVVAGYLLAYWRG